MGLVYAAAEIGPTRARLVPVEFMVDTGSFYTFVGPALVKTLGLDLPESTTVIMANGTRVDVPVGFAFLRMRDREGGILVASMDVPQPLLGATALQALGIKVNPAQEILEFSDPYPPPV